MPAGLAGLCAAISGDARSQRAVSGVALYAPWDATDADWGVWKTWQGVEQDGERGQPMPGW